MAFDWATMFLHHSRQPWTKLPNYSSQGINVIGMFRYLSNPFLQIIHIPKRLSLTFINLTLDCIPKEII